MQLLSSATFIAFAWPICRNLAATTAGGIKWFRDMSPNESHVPFVLYRTKADCMVRIVINVFRRSALSHWVPDQSLLSRIDRVITYIVL
jgi:hypothetical protein